MKTILLLLLALFLTTCAWATTVTFQNGASSYTGEVDATILPSSTNEELTYGTIHANAINNNTGIIGFDVSSIPTNATVSSATLTLYVQEQNCNSGVTLSVYPISNPDNSGLFTVASTSTDTFSNYATWHYKNHTNSTKWSTAGGNVSFADVNGTSALDTKTVTACPSFESKTFTITSAVQSWVTTPASNGGLFLNSSSGQYVLVDGLWNGTQSNNPLLSVTYTANSVPTVTTQSVTSIGTTTATGNGNITATSGSNATYEGVVYDTATHTLPGNVAPGSSGYASVANTNGSFSTGAFTQAITGLTNGTTYYVRAYAQNSGGYSYGSEVSFTTNYTVVSKIW
jgi:hypothetical protein